MDYIEYCHKILQILEDRKYDLELSPLALGTLLYGEQYARGNFWGTAWAQALLVTCAELKSLKLIEERGIFYNISSLGQEVLHDPYFFWEPVCRVKLEEAEERLLRMVNKFSPADKTDPVAYVELLKVKKEQMLSLFNLGLPEKWGTLSEEYDKVLRGLPFLLDKKGFAHFYGELGYSPLLSSSYRGLVWETRRAVTRETKLIDKLLEEWETTNVDFKQEMHLDTKEQKADFAKDVLSLANTKSSGRRFLIIGFDDKTRGYHAPPGGKITQQVIESVLNHLTSPVVSVRYEELDYREGKVGKLEILREPVKLPYRAARTVKGPNNKTCLRENAVYVRHNTMNQELIDIDNKTHPELINLIEEGERARNQ